MNENKSKSQSQIKAHSYFEEKLNSLNLSNSQVNAVMEICKDLNESNEANYQLVQLLRNEKNEINNSLQDTIKELANSNDQKQKFIESNMQLENFAHIASHDLKAPLTNIVSLTLLMMRKSNEKLDSAERELLHNISISAQSMKDTIKGLFEFSTASNAKLNKQLFSSDKIVQQVLLNIDSQIRTADAKIETSCREEYIYADPVLLKEVFQNIILNAIKFVKIGTKVNIKINVEELEQSWLFSIKDNGIGIEPEFLENIFLIFKRLHTKEEYEGTGIGLAICKKIIDLHNGEIWIESELDVGTTFHFTIPKDK